jgi:ribonucrease Y
MSFWLIIALVVAATAGTTAGYIFPSTKTGEHFMNEEKKLEETKTKATEIRAEAKEQVEQMKKAFKREEESMLGSIEKMKNAVDQKEDILKRREDRNRSYEGNVKTIKNEIKKLIIDKEEIGQNIVDKLAKTTGLSQDEALKQARQELENVITDNADIRQKAELEEYEEDIMRHATAVVQLVVQRLGVQSSVDKNSTSINVPNDKFKGLLIGKDGKNVAHLESLLPVSIIFNLGDPKTIHVGGINLLRRNVAKRAIEKMQRLTRRSNKIDKAMIDKTVAEAKKEVIAQCNEKGTWAFKEVGLDPKKADPKLVNLMGRLYFRTSYGQNVLFHTIEMTHAARVIAELIGSDVDTAVQATFFHDLGKAVDHDIGGSHDEISKELIEKFGYPEAVAYAAGAHHDRLPCKSPADFIVKATDGISGSRPGARQESIVQYFERMKQLEQAAQSFDGVSKVFTMSAGREVRVVVNKDQIKDSQMPEMAEGIADKIEEEVSFPGTIKVNLIRLTKSVDYAREQQKRK